MKISIKTLFILLLFSSCVKQSQIEKEPLQFRKIYQRLFYYPTSSDEKKNKLQEELKKLRIIPKNKSKSKASNTVSSLKRENITKVIQQINQAINNRDFKSWNDLLDVSYREKILSEENIKRISLLFSRIKHKVTINNLKDYFDYVIVPSHNQRDLGNFVIFSDNRIRVYSQKKEGEEKNLVLYNFILVDNYWKVGYF